MCKKSACAQKLSCAHSERYGCRTGVTGDKKNTITVYNLTESAIIGNRKAPKKDYDLITVVMIGLGDYSEAAAGSVLRMLDVIFSTNLEPDDKKKILSEEYEIPMTEREVREMCNLSEGIYENGVQDGENNKAITTAQNFLKLNKVTIEDIAMCTGLTVEEVKQIEKDMYATA